MRMEKRFYTEEAALWERAEQMAEKERMELTDEERISKESEAALKAQEIEERAGTDRRHNFQVIHGERLKEFEILSQRALEFAEAAPLDIVVETEPTFGKIQLCADRLMILPSDSGEMKEIFAELIRGAESTGFTMNENGLLEIRFMFSFTSKQPRTDRR
ncbi:MAG: hypothetical protein LIO76_02595 [Clostridiales bacterium]|nr:hypothetical protein [Clostridiales bacterium]